MMVSPGMPVLSLQSASVFVSPRNSINRLLRRLHICHIHCGLEGPPADRVRLIGVDNRTMITILRQLKEGIAENTEMWRNHFQPASA